jgi:TetR/AcrR family transcriptional regulator
MAKVREKQLQKRKEETLDAALRMLTERGYANLSMDDLADEVGISKPTLYQYFNSKEELLSQVMLRMYEKMDGHFSLDAEVSPVEQLKNFLRKMLTTRFEGRSVSGVGDIEVMRNVMKNNPVILERLSQTKDKLAAIVQLGQEQGEIDPNLPAWLVVNMMFAMQRVIHNPFFDKNSAHRSDEELLVAIEAVMRMFQRSVTLPESEKVPVTPQ